MLVAVILVVVLVVLGIRAASAALSPTGAAGSSTPALMPATSGAPPSDGGASDGGGSPAGAGASDGGGPAAAAPESAAPAPTAEVAASVTGDGIAHTGVVGDGTWAFAAPTGAEHTESTVHTYALRVEGGIGVEADDAAAEIASILGDDRGWRGVEEVAFRQVATEEEADFTISIASPPRSTSCALRRTPGEPGAAGSAATWCSTPTAGPP